MCSLMSGSNIKLGDSVNLVSGSRIGCGLHGAEKGQLGASVTNTLRIMSDSNKTN